MIQAERLLGAIVGVALLGQVAGAQGIDDRIFIPNLKAVEGAKPAPWAPAAVPAPVRRLKTGHAISVQIGARRQLITLEAPESPDPGPGDEWDEEPDQAVAPPVRGLDLRISVIERENFDRVVFGGTERAPRSEHLERVLLARLAREALVYQLGGEQREKLRLAGLGDIKRLFGRVEETRAEFDAARGRFNEAIRVLRRALPLSDEYQVGPFGKESLFAKTLRTIEEEQAARR